MIKSPESEAAEVLCDWVEASLLFRESRLSRTDIEDALEEAGLATEDSVDARIAEIWGEGERRHRGCSGGYPIRWETRSAERAAEWNEAVVYSFMLLLSLSHHHSVLRLARAAAQVPAELFEYLSVEAYRWYIGGTAFRFGDVRRRPVPRGFNTAVEYLSQQTEELLGPIAARAAQRGDDGLDVVVWRGFPDGRSGKLVLLAQCAIGHTWRNKLTDLVPTRWYERVRWGVDPVRSIALPVVHREGDEWHMALRTAGIVLDRLRITGLAHAAQSPIGGLRERIVRWCRQHIRRVLALR